MKNWVPAILGLLLAITTSAAPQSTHIYDLNGRIPLGVESFRLKPANRQFYIMASVENRELEGLYRRIDGAGHPHLFDSENKAVSFYPSRVQFRLTASAREKLIDDAPFDLRAKVGVETLITGLRFRIKVFRGLEYWYIKPAFVEQVGVPSSVHYNERIYRVGFTLGKLPIDDRVVMEVLSPNGERLCKFHLDLL